jgi:hypothetical protein
MAQATTHTKFAAYAEPAVNAALLTEDKYVELTQEQHTVEEWNRILLAFSKGAFTAVTEYDEIKKRAYKASGFSKALLLESELSFRIRMMLEIFLMNWISQYIQMAGPTCGLRRTLPLNG